MPAGPRIPTFPPGSVSWVSGRTGKRWGECIEARTPIAGEGLLGSPEHGGVRLSIDPAVVALVAGTVPEVSESPLPAGAPLGSSGSGTTGSWEPSFTDPSASSGSGSSASSSSSSSSSSPPSSSKAIVPVGDEWVGWTVAEAPCAIFEVVLRVVACRRGRVRVPDELAQSSEPGSLQVVEVDAATGEPATAEIRQLANGALWAVLECATGATKACHVRLRGRRRDHGAKWPRMTREQAAASEIFHRRALSR